MSTRTIAEAVILQCMEDLWDERHYEESTGFFFSEEFSILAELARMSTEDKLRLLKMVEKINVYANKSTANDASKADRANSSPLALSAPPIFR